MPILRVILEESMCVIKCNAVMLGMANQNYTTVEFCWLYRDIYIRI